MNQVHIIVQSKDDPTNLLSSQEKADNFPEGLTVVFMEGATEKGQMGVELIFKGKDIYGRDTITGFAVTENNWEAVMGGFIGARMRFLRMPMDQYYMVRQYVKGKAQKFIETLDDRKRKIIENDIRKFFSA